MHVQVTLRCALSRRQAQLYAALRKNLTLQDLVAMNSKMAAAAAAAGAGGGAAPAAPVVSSSAASARLMGLIMQMRKVGGGLSCCTSARIAMQLVNEQHVEHDGELNSRLFTLVNLLCGI